MKVQRNHSFLLLTILFLSKSRIYSFPVQSSAFSVSRSMSDQNVSKRIHRNIFHQFFPIQTETLNLELSKSKVILKAASRLKDDISPSSPSSIKNFVMGDSRLNAATVGDLEASSSSSFSPSFDMDTIESSLTGMKIPDGVMEVVSASLLITANTVGASMLAVPKVVAGPGLVPSTGIFFGVYLYNLFSGLYLAEVAINQYEASECDVPSSFKEFADVNLQSKTAGNFISCISVFVNWCVLAYNLVMSGEIAVSSIPFLSQLGGGVSGALGASDSSSVLFAIACCTLVGTQNDSTLSRIASICCTALFVSFAGMVLPSIAAIHDPISAFMAPGTSTLGSESFWNNIFLALPVIVSALNYQNIVPSITKLLDYDRTKTTAALALGSFIPMLMFAGFSFAVLGGGLNLSIDSGGALLLAFSAASIIGSSIACTMSLTEEFNSFLSPSPTSNETPLSKEEECKMNNEPITFSMLSGLLAVAPPLVAGILFSGGEEFLGALHYSGGYGAPILYGLIPVLLASSQRFGWTENVSSSDKKNQDADGAVSFNSIFNGSDKNEGLQYLVPGGSIGLGMLGTSSAMFFSQQMLSDFFGVFTSTADALV